MSDPVATRHGIPMEWGTAAPSHTAGYLAATIAQWLRDANARRVLDLGCGNGALTIALARLGFEMTGIDGSDTGIRLATDQAPPGATFRQAWIDDPLPADLHGAFDAVVAVEVIEHLPAPGALCRRAREALAHGGPLIITTPYHGYLKNLALALAGGFDRHWQPLWDGGHIKFFSRRSLTALLEQQAFAVSRFARRGRVPPLAKSMIVEAYAVAAEGPVG